MTQTKQAVRLQFGHLATFRWRNCMGEERKETWLVGKFANSTTTPPTVTSEWLKDFFGKEVGHVGIVNMAEDNILEMTLIDIRVPGTIPPREKNLQG